MVTRLKCRFINFTAVSHRFFTSKDKLHFCTRCPTRNKIVLSIQGLRERNLLRCSSHTLFKNNINSAKKILIEPLC